MSKRHDVSTVRSGRTPFQCDGAGPSNQVLNSHYQLGCREGLFQKIYEVGGESFEVCSVSDPPICNGTAREEKNGQAWIKVIQSQSHVRAGNVGQFDVAHEQREWTRLPAGLNGLQPGGYF